MSLLKAILWFALANTVYSDGPELDYTAVIAEQNAKIAELTASLAKVEGREGFCYVKYNGKCFWIETNYNRISCNKGREMCAARGGTPANIYSEEHYNMIKEYVRRQIPTGDNILNLWLGMSFNVRTMTASLFDGTPAPFLRWHQGYPRSTAGWNCIAFDVRVPWNTRYQDMYNQAYTYNRKGVLCQKD